MVRTVRATEPPFPVLVGGTPAVSVDTFDLIYDPLPLSLMMVALGSFILLFLLTGSLLLPIKAMLLSLLSLTATFGALVYIFQEGHLQSIVGDFIVTGAITWTVPILVFALGFGLSIDYQVFILSRITRGVRRTGERGGGRDGHRADRPRGHLRRALTSIVFFVWITSGISYMKAIGVGCRSRSWSTPP